MLINKYLIYNFKKQFDSIYFLYIFEEIHWNSIIIKNIKINI
jgi:hypothetical protein